MASRRRSTRRHRRQPIRRHQPEAPAGPGPSTDRAQSAAAPGPVTNGAPRSTLPYLRRDLLTSLGLMAALIAALLGIWGVPR